jgi:hypothetical protein
VIIFIVVLIFIAIYIWIVRPRIKTYKYIAGILDDIDGGALHGWALVSARFAGVKTIILSSMAGIIPLLPATFDNLQSYTGWSAFFEQATANKIGAACAALSMITHAMGIESAAKSEPKK